MTENPSTSSAAKSAKSALLPKNSQDALRVTVELYNEGLPREDQLNWQNVKGIFDTKETSVLADIKSVFTSKEKKERYAQIERDANCVRYYVEIVQACPALDAAHMLLQVLDFQGVIKVPDRRKWPLREVVNRKRSIPPWR
jgi:hypothetical protein